MKIIKRINIKIIYFINKFKLINNNFIKNFKIILENYNNFKKVSTILICHALTGSHHFSGVYMKNLKNIGWWNNMINNNKKNFKKNYNILCLNNIGSCYGSTNPNNKNPFKNKIYEFNFPKLKINDFIKIQKLTLNKIKINNIFILLGGSLGGLQIILWNIIFPNISKFYINIASTLKLSLNNKIYNEINKLSIINNYKFYKNKYYNYKFKCIKGLKLTRIISHITYLSKYDYIKKINIFLYKDNYKKYIIKSKISKYLHYQGNKFINYFNANSYLTIMKLLNSFNIRSCKFIKNKNYKINSNFLIITFKNDKRFTYKSSIKLFKFLLKINKNINFKIINTLYGHDSFLLKEKNYFNLINIYINKYISE